MYLLMPSLNPKINSIRCQRNIYISKIIIPSIKINKETQNNILIYNRASFWGNAFRNSWWDLNNRSNESKSVIFTQRIWNNTNNINFSETQYFWLFFLEITKRNNRKAKILRRLLHEHWRHRFQCWRSCHP